MKWVMGILLIISVLFMFGCGKDVDPSTMKTYNSANSSLEYIAIEDLVSSEFAGYYNILAYASYVYECPPCPKNAKCKPCAPYHIIIRSVSPDSDDEARAELKVLVNNSKEFGVGRKYVFSLAVSANGENTQYAELLSYDEVGISYVIPDNSLKVSLGEDKSWVEAIPMQCEFEPWQYDWIKAHGDNRSAYPWIDYPEKVKAEERKIIKAYFRSNENTIIHDVKSEWKSETTCSACGICADGYRLYLEIYDSNIERMKEFGYSVVNIDE